MCEAYFCYMFTSYLTFWLDFGYLIYYLEAICCVATDVLIVIEFYIAG